MAEPPPALELRGLTAGHGDTVVLEGLELALGPGESLSVLGRNGIGKTTLIDTIMGHTRVRAGAIRFAGREIVRWPPWRRARAGLGYVPQEREIFQSLSVREHLRIAARPGPWTIERAFATFPALAERRQHRGDALSGGEQQMLAIARALLTNPELLLMDEPSEGLSPLLIQQVVEVIGHLRTTAELPILLVEQNLSLALNLADYVYVMKKGAVAFEGPAERLANAPDVQHTYLGV